MPNFSYRARRLSGETTAGTLTADNERAALSSLDRQGLFPLELQSDAPSLEPLARPASPPTSAPAADPDAPVRSPGASEIARLMRQLADLVRAGVPLARALHTLETQDSQHGGQQVIWAADDRGRHTTSLLVASIRREIEAGGDLGSALANFPQAFPSAAVGIVRAGEAGGFLEDALERVAAFTEREIALVRRVRSALAYPALLAVLGSLSVVFLITWVVPRFEGIYSDMGGALPLPTRILLGASDLLQQWWPLAACLAAIAAVAAWQLKDSEPVRRGIDRLLLKIPGIRGVTGRAALARFTRTLGMLLQSGVPILEALGIAHQACGNREFSHRLQTIVPHVRQGQDLAGPLAATGLVPATVASTIAVAQESGRLGEILEEVGERLDQEIDHALRVMLSFLEPLLIAAMAGVVFFIVLATLLPVFTLNTLVN